MLQEKAERWQRAGGDGGGDGEGAHVGLAPCTLPPRVLMLSAISSHFLTDLTGQRGDQGMAMMHRGPPSEL